jgi:glycosyltransferase involved in cell wall biosynthesis
MECRRIALIFQGTTNNDARVRREVQSISEFSKIDVFSSDVRPGDHQLFNSNVKLIQFKLADTWLNRNLFFSKQFKAAQELIDPMEYDSLICIDYHTLKIGVNLKRKNPNLKLVYDSHEIYIETINQFFPRKGWRSIYGIPMKIINKMYHNRQEKKLVADAEIIVTVCDSLKRYFEKNWQKKVFVLKNCPEIESLDKLPSTTNPYIDSFGCGEEDRILIYQGDINPGRGLFHLINTMNILSSEYKLFIIGSGMLKDDLIQLKKSLKLENVFFVDQLPYDQLFNYTRYAHLGISLIEPINLSKKLSLPNKLFEYMYCGVPFLSSDLPEPRNLLKQADVGYICADFKKESIKSSIEEAFANVELFKLKGENARNSIINLLNWTMEFDLLIKEIETSQPNTYH